ncbi:efflux RND transporter periplasmic adaptor subunit [Porcipelethomonas sp.]|uniref:efflux RND transporter periplasmic adaptor subunit n=1 Tax=Porcipelethomonas sp. TaxID=2981675 RepID=UPI003EF90661
MEKKKKIIIASVSAAVVLAAAAAGIILWKTGSDNESSEKVFVTPVSDINTVNAMSLSGECFSGVIESQKTLDVKYDTTKQIKEILVKEGDQVEEGTELFTYDVESMELDLEQGELEIEKYNNDIDSMEKQITQLENDKKNASSDDQYSYSAQIQSLKTDISKAEYDIKVKKAELEKLKNSIKNATVKSEMAGTVNKINSADGSGNQQEDMYGGDTSDADVVMTIIASGDFRVKGKINEQNMMAIYADMPVIIRSRTDDTITWNGTISEIGSEPEQNSDYNMYGETDEMTSSSNYPFYVTLDNIDGLMLGQHVIIEPDFGQLEAAEKTGVWIYEDYIVTDDDGKTYVWVSGKKDKLEKKYVEVGEKDENYGDCEIVSGLTDEDNIAYPSDDYKEGMPTTADIDEAGFEEEFQYDDEDIMPDDIDGDYEEYDEYYDENGEPLPGADEQENPEDNIDDEDGELLPDQEDISDIDAVPAG